MTMATSICYTYILKGHDVKTLSKDTRLYLINVRSISTDFISII
jgi:hypothetical protein